MGSENPILRDAVCPNRVGKGWATAGLMNAGTATSPGWSSHNPDDT